MKIAQITAGAGGMYCGSCLRDNTLAAALLAAGHDVSLIPTYTPTRTDEPNVSGKRVFLGGINVFLEQHVPLFRHVPRVVHRALDAGPLLALATRWNVKVEPARLGSLTVSMLKGRSGFQRAEVDTLVRHLEELAPDVVIIPNSLLLGLAPALKATLRAPLCCTLQGEDFFLEGLGEPHRGEALRLIRSHVPHVDRFIAVSRFCARSMSHRLELPPEKVRVVRLGINMDGYERSRPAGNDVVTIGYLARIAPEKGLHVLCDAYRRLRRAARLPECRLVAAGYLGAEHREYLAQVRREMDAAGLSAEFQYLGELDRKAKIVFLQGLDIFSVPGPYDETKGIFLLEAMAAGTPVVQPRRGVYPELIEATGGGLLVPPDDPEGLAEAIRLLAADAGQRRELGAAAHAGVRRHFTATRMAEEALAVYGEVLAETAAGRGGQADA